MPSLCRPPPDLGGLLAATLMVGATTIAGAVFRAHIPSSSMPLLFLLAVLIASVRFGFWIGIFASILAFLAENFFFIEPYFTFHVAEVGDWLTLIVLLAAGATTGFLVGRLSEEADAARTRAFALEIMAQCAADLATSETRQNVLETLLRHLARLSAGEVLMLAPENGRLVMRAAHPTGITLDSDDQQAAERASRRGGTEQPAAPGWSGGRFAFHSLGEKIGVIGFTLAGSGLQADKQMHHACHAVIEQAVLALGRLDFAEEAAGARADAEREALRAALLSSLSHDLKTPLATIMGGVTSLREFGELMPEVARKDTLLAIEQEAERLARYVGNLLHMTRLKAGLDVRTDWIDVTDAALGATTRARRAYPDRVVKLESSGVSPIIRSDAVLLEQAIFNLVDNALKFSPVDTAVRIGVEGADDKVAIRVSDAGPGISEGEQSRVFDAFYRGGEHTQPGTGLGLAIVRGIVQALGGIVAVESRPAGSGTTMRVTLPREAMPS